MIKNIVGILGEKENVFLLKTEDEAWDFLAKLKDNEFQLPDDIAFGDWANLQLYLKGEKWHSSLTTSVFPVYEELQRSLNKAYAIAKYDSKGKKLSREEKELLEIVIKVGPGSSDTDTKYDLTEIAKELIKKMGKRELLIIILSMVLTYGGTTMYRDYMQNTRDIRIIESQNSEKKAMLENIRFLSEEETKRTEILRDIIIKNHTAQKILEDSQKIHKEMLKSATHADTTKINGVEIEKHIATELIKTGKEKATPLQINGTFQVLGLDWGDPNQISLRRISDGVTVKAVLDLDLLSKEAKVLIRDTEWREDGKEHLNANINARIAKGKIVSAVLASVIIPE